MVRVSGKSVLYLPAEHAPGAIVLPTCIRATAQHLAHNAMTRGIFRIPGSVKIVNALFDYYCYIEGGGAGLSGTVRCVNLPMHIQSSVHDVASTFKKMLSVLPGGILGSLSVFDAMVAIHSQLHGSPEFPRTKQTRVRARLIALAIATIKSQFRRELICAVFGLLSLIGRIAEVTPREDDEGRALPTSDLMGYNALGIVFGPLLVGELLDQYTMKITNPGSGLMLFPVTPQKLRRDRRKSKPTDGVPPAQTNVDKVIVANSIAEMLVTNWRDVVRQMKALGTHKRKDMAMTSVRAGSLRPSASETFIIKKPQDWDNQRAQLQGYTARNGSPGPPTPTMGTKRQRPRHQKSANSANLAARAVTALSPTFEEGASTEGLHDTVTKDGHRVPEKRPETPKPARQRYAQELLELEAEVVNFRSPTEMEGRDEHAYKEGRRLNHGAESTTQENIMYSSPQVSLESVPLRTSSRPRQTATNNKHPQPLQESPLNDSPVIGHHPSVERTRGPRGTRETGSEVDERFAESSSVPISQRKRPAPRPTAQFSRTSNTRKQSVSTMSRTQSTSTFGDKRNGGHSELTLARTEPLPASHEEPEPSTRVSKTTASHWIEHEHTSDSEDQGSPGQGHGYFHLSASGNVERYERLKSPEQVSRTSETPRQFYAPMRTPSNLLEPIHAEHTDSPATRTEA
jgi:hypothetical protein